MRTYLSDVILQALNSAYHLHSTLSGRRAVFSSATEMSIRCHCACRPSPQPSFSGAGQLQVALFAGVLLYPRTLPLTALSPHCTIYIFYRKARDLNPSNVQFAVMSEKEKLRPASSSGVPSCFTAWSFMRLVRSPWGDVLDGGEGLNCTRELVKHESTRLKSSWFRSPDRLAASSICVTLALCLASAGLADQLHACLNVWEHSIRVMCCSCSRLYLRSSRTHLTPVGRVANFCSSAPAGGARIPRTDRGPLLTGQMESRRAGCCTPLSTIVNGQHPSSIDCIRHSSPTSPAQDHDVRVAVVGAEKASAKVRTRQTRPKPRRLGLLARFLDDSSASPPRPCSSSSP